MTITHISLDLETWGTAPGCDIRSIGACVFDPVSGWTPDPSCELAKFNDRPVEPRFYIACDNPRVGYRKDVPKYPLTRDPQTVAWWNDQSDEARAAFADLVDLRECLVRFAAWMDGLTNSEAPPQHCANVCLWSHGAAFDPPILAAAYAAVGLPVPWHYRAPRDTRTAFDMAGIDDHSAWLGQHPGPLGLLHHALDDAISQARAVCGAYGRLRVPHVKPRGSKFAPGYIESMGDLEDRN